MARASSSPEAMDRMIKNITKFLEVQESMVATLERDYVAVGQEWNDPNYEKLAAVIDEVTAGIKGNYPTLSSCISKIQILKSMLEEYLSQSF